MLAANFSVLQVSDKSNTIYTAKCHYVNRQQYHYTVFHSGFRYLPLAFGCFRYLPRAFFCTVTDFSAGEKAGVLACLPTIRTRLLPFGEDWLAGSHGAAALRRG